jgi:predicted  nucleic acid-binding Zn-ribbon protein
MHHDKIMQIAEELGQTRNRVETTLVNLRTQLSALRSSIDAANSELELQGLDASLVTLIAIEEKASAISRNIKDLKQQSASLEQALGYIKSAKRLANS